MSEDDFTDEQREMEERLKEKWSKTRADGKAQIISAPVEYHMYTHQIADEKGGADTYWRFDRIEGSNSDIHREVNSKMMAMMELEKLRKAGFTVHVIATPETMTLEAKARQKEELMEKWRRSQGFYGPHETLFPKSKDSA
ncbi:hypothetical protein [Agrobacterium pusense]|uniref:hypothetical protein n=1 Tax=Agrobacterium pusense TaxID=648995 RepID=UPI00289CD4B1|nr:hypothetical protein [Agrobacterium pusense]